MLTLNADAHSLMSRLHKAGPGLGPDEQEDERSVVPIELGDVDQGLDWPDERAAGLVRMPRIDTFDTAPAG